jgi:hypothetical protein
MKLIALLFVAIMFAGCSANVVKHQPAPEVFAPVSAPDGLSPSEPMFQFSGAWEGTLNGHDGPNLVDGLAAKRAFRIVVDAKQVHVFQQLDGHWSEMKAGTFHISNWASQAVISSLTAGKDKDGTWVENSSFTLVHHSPSSIIAYWLRTVNNLNLPVDNPDFHFGWEFSGEMHQVKE